MDEGRVLKVGTLKVEGMFLIRLFCWTWGGLVTGL